ncbi:ATP-grasp fold amidoligase family protein [Microbacterium sp. NPDC088619]|uniref:ATP-grasp fold amidoligase family protein n=1 Tax=Microbacterium sp. NPDC088619 TaxID=3364196 RepID=UPI0037FA78B7
MTYLSLMRQRFSQRNPAIDPVPWELDDKYTAYEFVSSLGYKVPRYIRTETVGAALEAGMQLGDRFVVKQPNRHSTKGVYILQRLAANRFLELLSFKELTASDIKADGPEPDYWLAEECLPSLVSGRPLPFDYKIYAFRGQVSHITQIDRNVQPPRVAVFDGAFIPLVLGSHYTIDVSRWLLGHHVLPKYAGAMLEMAAALSRSLDTRFVKVDCFDGPDGPVFGEFTFASGGDDVGMIRYEESFLNTLNGAIHGEGISAVSGFDIDIPSFAKSLDSEPTIATDQAVLRLLSAGAVQGDRRYAPALIQRLRRSANRPVFELAANVIGVLNGDHSRAFSVQAAVRQGSSYLVGTSRLDEFENMALEFHDGRAENNPWHRSRAAEVRVAAGDLTQVAVLRDLAADGYEHARRVMAKYGEGSL